MTPSNIYIMLNKITISQVKKGWGGLQNTPQHLTTIVFPRRNFLMNEADTTGIILIQCNANKLRVIR